MMVSVMRYEPREREGRVNCFWVHIVTAEGGEW